MNPISRRDFIKLSAAGIAYLAVPSLLSGCGIVNQQMDRKTDNIAKLSAAGLAVDDHRIAIPGLQREYHFVVINDLHIIIPNEEVRQDAMEKVMARYEQMFIDDEGTKSYLLWEQMVETLGSMDVDGVILAADMIDYFSQANVEHLRKGCEQISAPVMYVRADHDYNHTYCKETAWEVVDAAHKTIDENAPVFVMDYEDFLVVGINNTTSQLTEEAWVELEGLLEGTKPIVLVSHVPYESLVDTGLTDASRAVWNDRSLLWAYEGSLYPAVEYSGHLLDKIYAPDSPVVEVLGGHLHFAYDGPLTDKVWQHVFDASSKGTLGYVVLSADT